MKASPLAAPAAIFNLVVQSNGVLPGPLFPVIKPHGTKLTFQVTKFNPYKLRAIINYFLTMKVKQNDGCT